MNDALTPEEQAELAYRMQRSGPTIGVGNPDARRVEVPSDPNLIQAQAAQDTARDLADKKDSSFADFFKSRPPTPSQQAQADMSVGAAMGSMNGMTPALAAPAKAVGRGARSIVDFIGGKLAGLAPEEVAAYKAAPRTVEALTKAPELRNQQFAESALNSVSGKLGKRAGKLTEDLATKFEGKSVPESSLQDAPQFSPKKSQGFVNGSLGDAGFDPSYQNTPYDKLPPHAQRAVPEEQIPVSRVYKGAQEAGAASRFAPSPIDPLAEKARSEAAGKEFGVLRGAVSKAAPEAESTIEDLKQGIEAQQGLKRGANAPISFIKSAADDTAAARQLADQVSGGTRLERTSHQVRAANALSKNPSKLTEKIAQPVGKALLRGSNAVSGPAAKAADLSAFIGGHASTNLAPGMRAAGTKAPDDALSPAEQEELNRYLKQQR